MSKPSNVAYVDALESASEMAIAELDEVLAKLDLDKPVECKQVLLAAVPAITDKYGSMAAAAAAEYYESERSAVLGGHYKPIVADPVDHEAVRAKVRYALRYLFEDGADGE